MPVPTKKTDKSPKYKFEVRNPFHVQITRGDSVLNFGPGEPCELTELEVRLVSHQIEPKEDLPDKVSKLFGAEYTVPKSPRELELEAEIEKLKAAASKK